MPWFEVSSCFNKKYGFYVFKLKKCCKFHFIVVFLCKMFQSDWFFLGACASERVKCCQLNFFFQTHLEKGENQCCSSYLESSYITRKKYLGSIQRPTTPHTAQNAPVLLWKFAFISCTLLGQISRLLLCRNFPKLIAAGYFKLVHLSRKQWIQYQH